jgi:proton-coupled amino acid transporter
MADAVKNAGIILGPIATLVIAIISIACMHMLVDATDYIMELHFLESRPDFARVVELCFSSSKHERWRKYSRFMKTLCNLSICITQLGFCCVYFLFVSKSMKIILDYYGFVINLKLLIVIVLGFVLLETMVRHLKNIGEYKR